MPLEKASPASYAFYSTREERGKSARRTVEWTLPQLRRFEVLAGARVLSVGCGNGMDVWTLRENGYEAFGVDPQLSADPGPYLARASGAELPFAAGSFDAVLSLEVIEHVDLDGAGTRKRFAEELQRVTRPGGVIVIATPNRYFPIDEHGEPLRLHSPFEPHTFSFGQLCELFSGCTAHPLRPAKYFAFRRFARLGGEWCPRVLETMSNLLGSRPLHASPLNPHLYVGFIKK